MKRFPLPGARPHHGPDRPFVIAHYDLDLRPDLVAHRLAAVCTISLRTIDDGLDRIVLDAVDLRVAGVRDAAGTELAYRTEARTLTVLLDVPLAAGDRFAFAVAYAVEDPVAGLHFIGPTPALPERPRQCWTQSQDEFARYWFPCTDAPSCKATMTQTIVVPRGLVALGNGRPVSREAIGDEVVFRYAQDVPHATYLATMVVGEFVEVVQDARGGPAPVSYFVEPGREADGERTFGRTPEMIEVLGAFAGTPYPWPRYAQVAVADFIFGGMENTAMTTQTDRVLHDERAALDFDAEYLVAHELGHQWFGDLLTTRDWSHAWLNEGFATFCEAVWFEAARGRDEYLYAMFANAAAYLGEVRDRYARPIVCTTYCDPIELFDRHLYDKGALVLHGLRGELGEDRFARSIARYVRTNAGANVETIDLVRAVEAETGRNVRAYVEQWVERAGHPKLKFSGSLADDGRTLRLRVEQKQEITDEAPAYRVALVLGLAAEAPAVPATDAGPDPAPGEERYVLDLASADETFVVRSREPIALVRIDPGMRTIGELEFAPDLPLLAEILRGDADPVARIRAARALVKKGDAAAQAALRRAATAEPFYGVRCELARALGTAQAPWAQALAANLARTGHRTVRRPAAEALGGYRTEAAASTLLDLAEDESYLVVAQALISLGKTRDPRAHDRLAAALDEPSWNESFACGAIRGLAESATREAGELVLGRTAVAYVDSIRRTATRALGRIARLVPDLRVRAVDDACALLADASYFVRDAAIDALATASDARGIGPLERASESATDGRLRRRATEAARTIRAAGDRPTELAALREELDALRAEVARLRVRDAGAPDA